MPNEARAIKQIPLSHRRPLDSRVWIGTRRGNFTVKSAYWLLVYQQQHQQVHTSSSSNGVINVFWNRVWAAKVPPKVKLFIWRACRNILPTLTKLFERKASSSFSCSWCSEALETNDHVLWQCDFAQKVWRACPVNLPSSCDARLPLWDFISICLRELSSPELEIVFVTMWSLWLARNNLIWDAKVPNVDDICHRATGLPLDFLEHYEPEFQLSAPAFVPSVPHKWCPLEPGLYKINVACHEGLGASSVGLGIVIRDSMGLVAVAVGSTCDVFLDTLHAQAMVVLCALQLAHETGFHHICLKVCSSELLRLINRGSPSLAPCGVLIDDIVSWIPFFNVLKFAFIRKNCNKAALALARETASSNLDFTVLEECPPCILSFFQFDSIQQNTYRFYQKKKKKKQR